jgi:hypothetical protein
MLSKPRLTSTGERMSRLVIDKISTDTHYKIHQAANYHGEQTQNFIIRACKYAIAIGNIPPQALQHPDIAPMDVSAWLIDPPGIKLITYVDANGIGYTDQDLIAIGKAAIKDHFGGQSA